MNKQLTLEELQDRVAYPLTVIRKPVEETTPSLADAMMAVAKAEMKRHGMRCGAVPKSNAPSEMPAGVKARQRILEFVESLGAVTNIEICKGVDMKFDSARNHIATLTATGKLTCKRRKGLASIYSIPSEQ